MRWRRWSRLSRVERVDVYTRTSLYIVLWVFCGSVVLAAVAGDDDLSPGVTTAALVGAAIVTAFGSAALAPVIDLYPATRPLPWRRVGPLLVAAAAYVAVLATITEGEAQNAAVVVAVVNVAGALGGVPDRTLIAVLVVGSGAVAGAVALEPRAAVAGAVISAFIIFTVRASLWLLGIVAELDDARVAQTRLAVAEERLRFSRDVHDVLGRRLSAIAVQAELAATLADRGDESAAARMLDVRGIAHDALAEARELARGYRPTDFPTELDGATSLLRSAGIEARTDADVVPRGWHEAAGWVVREAVTNVLRHSEARVVDISYADGVLRVGNDGAPVRDAGDGEGLRGLRERLGALGATLDVAAADGRWTVAARLPGTGPLSTAASSGASEEVTS